MSSTLAVGTPTPVASSVSSNAPSPSSVSPTYIPSSSSRVNTVPLLSSATTSPTQSTSAPIASAFSEQSQRPSSILQTTMAVTTVATTAVASSASPSVPSSTASLISARLSSTSSTLPSAIIPTSTDDNRSTTSTPATSVQTTTPSTTTVPSTIQSLTLTLPSLTTTMLDTITSSTSMSASTSNTPFTTTPSPPPSDPSSSRSSFPEKPAMPLTTVLESTTVFITETNSQGQVMTSIPRVVTEVITTTGFGGTVTTVTQAIVNPTLAQNNSTSGDPSFFTNTGAVVGVFAVVGLASASIMMWILFAIRHRQRMERIEQDTVVEAAVAAAGLNRAPLDDDDEGGSPISPNARHQFSSEMGQRNSLFGLGGSASLPTSTRLSEVLDDATKCSANSHPGCSTVHPRTTSPSSRADRCTDDLGSSHGRKSSYGHTPTYSAGSFEPLLANYIQNTSDQDPSALTMQPPRKHSELVSNGYSSDGSPEGNSSDSSVVGDEEDYTRYVLMVRNVPDDQSQHSL
ncbi:hypothetical protein EV363DRAFT_1312112 [Boletus edulis]|nr:hypothetical protein EV363DRAFT_1312112 [Boletus edulis]